MKKLNKKGMSLSDLPHVALIFLIAGVFFAVALIILTSLVTPGSTMDLNSATNSAVHKTITAVSEIPANWLLLIAVIVAAAVVIGIVVSSLGRGQEGRV